MKLIGLLFLIGLSAQTSNAQKTNRILPKDSLALKAKRLEVLYTLSTSSSADIKENYKIQFFEEFPESFAMLDSLYGYENHKPKVLYNFAVKHIYELFNSLKFNNDTPYYKKIINIAVGGHWDADAIDYFQSGLQQHVYQNPELICSLLQNMTDKQIESFWFFYFDGPHPKKQIDNSILRLASINHRVYLLIIKAHNEVLNQPE